MLPNILSIFRLLLVIPFFMVMMNNDLQYQRWFAFSIVVIAGLTDRFDGYIARKYNLSSEIGIIIDPLVDKIAITIFIIILWLWNNIATWFFVVVLGRDILILSAAIYLKQKYNKVIKSNTTGKITIFFISVALSLALLNYSQIYILKEIIILIATIYSFYSVYLYWQEFKLIVEEKV
ncbi:MAG: CDP-alcohol phosphatidyltransferase family protein [Bacteroidetes bacterium]|nr:CDP-alcohol phosphatidyltransferase family protein [Bacteroidota bacterium]